MTDVPIFDATGALSREFLLQRGYCCGNGCRNCPYEGEIAKDEGRNDGERDSVPPAT